MPRRVFLNPDHVTEVLRDLNHSRGIRVESLPGSSVKLTLTGFFRSWSADEGTGVYYTLWPEDATPNNSLRFTRETVAAVVTGDSMMPDTIMLRI